MTTIPVNSSMVEQLRNLAGPVQLCDEHGIVLGEFRPAIDRELYKRVKPLVSDEELRRREQAGGGRSLAEILADLRKQTS